MADIHVRSAQSSDVEEIVRLSGALFREDSGTRDPYTNSDWARQEGEGYFSNHVASDQSFTAVVEVDGTIIGYLVGYLRQPHSVRPVRIAELESMFVIPSERNSGLGQQLVEAFLSWSRERNAQRVSVTAFASNAGAIRFYQRCGFEPHNLTLERSV